MDNLKTIYYSGSWHSNLTNKVYGDIYVHLIRKDDNEKAKVMITYTGVFMKGLRRVLEFDISTSDNKSKAETSAPLYMFKGITDQNIQLEAYTKTSDIIEGRYNTKSPWDLGTFRVISVSKEYMDTITFSDHTPLSSIFSTCNII